MSTAPVVLPVPPEPQGKMACPECSGYAAEHCEECDGTGVLVQVEDEHGERWVSITTYLFGEPTGADAA